MERLRLVRAVAVGLGSWCLVPRLFPYFDPGPHVERQLGSVPGLAFVAPFALVAACLALAVGAYRYPAAGPAESSTAELAAPPASLSFWMLRLLVVALVGSLTLLAYANRFMGDDAFISFRYARNWVEGHGLVFNPGERVEGYTNFLWVVLVAGGMRLGVDPVAFTQGVGLICFAGTLWLTFRTARLVLPSAGWAFVAALMTGTNYTVLAFATSGLETSLINSLLVAGCWIVVRSGQLESWDRRSLIGLSLMISAGILTRMDFAVFGAFLIVAAIGSAWPPSSLGPSVYVPMCIGIGPCARRFLLIAAPVAFVLAAWLWWKWSYYGQLLPNTYYAKRAGPGAFALGLQYLADFAGSYRLGRPIVVVLAGTGALVLRRNVLAAFAAMIAIWSAYVAAMGGDFIEYRFIVPVVPMFMILLVWTLARFQPGHRIYLPVVVVLWTVHGSLAHYRTYGWDAHRAEPVSHLRWQTTETHWAEAGHRLNELFGEADVSIATTCAGILPYHARLRTLDMHGLTDPVVAREGRPVSHRPGHKRIASEAIMRQRGVNLVIGHPKIEPSAALDELPLEWLKTCAQGADPGTEAAILAIPISAREVLLAWYLTPHPAAERAMNEGKWRMFTVTAGSVADGE